MVSGDVGRGCQLCTVPLPHYSSPVSPREEPVNPSGTPIPVTAAQGTPQDHPALGPPGLMLAVLQDCVCLQFLELLS